MTKLALCGVLLFAPALPFCSTLSAQSSLVLSSGTEAAGGVSLNLTLTSPSGSEPAGLQWTFDYPTSSVLEFNVVEGSAVVSANKTISCAGDGSAYICLATGLNFNTIANGVVAWVTVTLAATSTPTAINLTKALGTSPDGGEMFISATGGIIGTRAATSVPQLAVGVSHIGNFTQGQNGAAYTITVQNTGTGAGSGMVTVTDVPPPGLTAASLGGTGWTCVLAGVTCTRSDFLAASSAYPPITLTVNVPLGAASPVANLANLSGGGSTPASATDTTSILAPFADVSFTDVFLPAIDLLREYSITTGCGTSPPMFCPTDNITRGDAAMFVVRSIMGGDNFTFTASPYFTDVPSTNPLFQWVQKMRDLGITFGCGPTTYCPDDPVTRGQIAVFIIRARFGSSAGFTYPSTPSFSDVTAASGFFPWIQKMGQIGITSGCSPTTYCPDDAVTREQMAVFVMRGAFNQLLPAGAPVIVSVSPAAGPRGYTAMVTLRGQNTNWVNGMTQVITGPGIMATNVVVTNATTLTAQLVIATNAVPGPYSLTATTGGEEATLPNGFTVQ